jgi:nucleoside-diphosphate-sugar epimerase
MKTVGIIGGSGFIGSWVTKTFLEENYKVKVSSTDITNKSKYEHLQTLANASNLEICAIDVLDIPSVEAFVKGCEIIVHAGTPFMLDVKDPQKELFEPTVKGTQNFLQIIATTAGIKKVVFIASVAAWNTSFPMAPASYPANHIFSENDTPYIGEQDHPYAQAKYYADQAVRKFITNHPEITFEITSVSPVFVIGNSLSSRQDSTSMGMQFLFKNKIAPNPFVEMLYANDVMFAMVDVTDVAQSIFNAATSSGLHGKNYILTSESYKISDITLMMNQEAPLNEPEIIYSNELAKKELGVAFISAKNTLNNCI